MRYDLLSQRHPDYRGAMWEELTDLYEGGYRIAKNAKTYLPQLVGERPERWEERRRSTGYLGYLGQIVDFFAAQLFSQEIAVTPAADAQNRDTPGTLPDVNYYGAFAQNVDLAGHSFQDLCRRAFVAAILKQRALVAVDFPKVDQTPQSLADEAAIGSSRAYAFCVPIETLIDWKLDAFGRFEWAILQTVENERKTPAGGRDIVTERFKIWTMTNGLASFEVHQFVYNRSEPPKADTESVVVDRDITSFPAIPLVLLDVPLGLWVGNKVGPIAKEHFQRRSALVAAQNKSLVAIPVVKKGPEMGAMGGAVPAEIQQKASRGNDPVSKFAAAGYVEIGKDDDIYFAEPMGLAYQLANKELIELKDEMFRVVHQMAAAVTNNSASLGRSGQSKQKDGEATAVVLGAFGSMLREFAKRIYETVSAARGESVVWTPRGLDNYQGEERADLIAEATSMALVDIPSLTFQQTYKTAIATKLAPNLPPDTQETIRQEIVKGVADAQARKEKLQAAADKAAMAPKPDPAAPANNTTPPSGDATP